MGQRPHWETDRRSSAQESSRLFAEPESTLSCSQQPSTGPWYESDESNLHLTPYLSNINFNIILPSKTTSSKLFLTFRFFDKNSAYIFLFSPCALYALKMSSSLIWSSTLNRENTVPRKIFRSTNELTGEWRT